jgi:hypothetical protein
LVVLVDTPGTPPVALAIQRHEKKHVAAVAVVDIDMVGAKAMVVHCESYR